MIQLPALFLAGLLGSCVHAGGPTPPPTEVRPATPEPPVSPVPEPPVSPVPAPPPDEASDTGHRVFLVAPQVQILDIIYFASNQAAAGPQTLPVIDDVAQVLGAHPEIQLLNVDGFSDATEKDGQVLSQRRADWVKNELVKMGISADRLQTHGFGALRPIGRDSTASGRAQNRRVSFRIASAGE